jgi:hypothetical protein
MTGWAGYVAGMRMGRNVYRIFMRASLEKCPFGRHGRRC